MWLIPAFLYPGPLYVLSALALGLALDGIYPYHKGVLLKVHPVHTSFMIAQRLFRPRASRLKGAAIWAAVMFSHLSVYGIALYLAWSLSPIAWILVAAYIVKISLSLRLLIDIVDNVRRSLGAGDLAEAKRWAQNIVRRDLAPEDPGHVASAAIESLAEGLVDGFISPLFWLSLLGPLGALAQRTVNTLDGALGFKDPDHLKAGFVSAWADTVVNFLPARLAAILIALLAPLGGGKIRGSLRSWLACRGLTESRNAGNPMSAIAGALNVVLEKRGSYTLCQANYVLPGPDEIKRAIRVSIAVGALSVSMSALIIAYI
ncbi:MAG: cobalamin biosynthesis protein [Acidilobus sp.]